MSWWRLAYRITCSQIPWSLTPSTRNTDSSSEPDLVRYGRKATARKRSSPPLRSNQRFENASRVRGSRYRTSAFAFRPLNSQAASCFNKACGERVGKNLNARPLEATDSRRITELPVGADGYGEYAVLPDDPLQQRITIRIEHDMGNAKPKRVRECGNHFLGPGSRHRARGCRSVAIPAGGRTFLNGLRQGHPTVTNRPTVLGGKEALCYRCDLQGNGPCFGCGTAIRTPPR